MHSSQKDNGWHFGMKAHIGYELKTGAHLHGGAFPLHSQSGCRLSSAMDILTYVDVKFQRPPRQSQGLPNGFKR